MGNNTNVGGFQTPDDQERILGASTEIAESGETSTLQYGNGLY